MLIDCKYHAHTLPAMLGRAKILSLLCIMAQSPPSPQVTSYRVITLKYTFLAVTSFFPTQRLHFFLMLIGLSNFKYAGQNSLLYIFTYIDICCNLIFLFQSMTISFTQLLKAKTLEYFIYLLPHIQAVSKSSQLYAYNIA